MKGKTYRCKKCQKEKTILPGEKIPACCDLPMTLKLEKCTKPFNAESARLNAADEPCDDGTDRGK